MALHWMASLSFGSSPSLAPHYKRRASLLLLLLSTDRRLRKRLEGEGHVAGDPADRSVADRWLGFSPCGEVGSVGEPGGEMCQMSAASVAIVKGGTTPMSGQG